MVVAGSGVESLLAQGQECEARGEYSQAIGWYCKVNSELTDDPRFVKDTNLLFFIIVFV